jgi:hypothetical protein
MGGRQYHASDIMKNASVRDGWNIVQRTRDLWSTVPQYGTYTNGVLSDLRHDLSNKTSETGQDNDEDWVHDRLG